MENSPELLIEADLPMPHSQTGRERPIQTDDLAILKLGEHDGAAERRMRVPVRGGGSRVVVRRRGNQHGGPRQHGICVNMWSETQG